MKIKQLSLAIFFATSLSCSSITFAADINQTFTQAATAFNNGDYDKAGKLFKEVGDILNKQDQIKAAQIYGNSAVAFIKAENYDSAIEIYNKIISTKNLPTDFKLTTYKNLIFCHKQNNENALQISTIENLLKSKDKVPQNEKLVLLATQGDAYRELELYPLAIKAYSEAIKLFNKKTEKEQQAKVYTALALSQGNLGDYNSAIDNLSKSLSILKDTKDLSLISDIYSNLGVINWEQGNYDKSLELLNKAIEIETKNNLTRNIGVDTNNIGLVYNSMGDYIKSMDHFNKSYNIAIDVKNVKDQGIAVVNRALVYRITGNFKAAEDDYNLAVKLFTDCGFREGIAGAHLGIGKMIFLKDQKEKAKVSNTRDLVFEEDESEVIKPAYINTLEHYQTALSIYEELKMPRQIAETKIQLALIYKDLINTEEPKAATRDLIFEEDQEENPTSVATISTEEAIKKMQTLNQEALDIAEKLMVKELIWAGHQGLGYVDFLHNNLESAYNHYSKAIGIVTGIYVPKSQVAMFGEYMANKEDLYSEAQQVASALYKKTNDQKYLQSLLAYSETLKNEIQKASANLSNIKFEDNTKQQLYLKLANLAKATDTATASLPQEITLSKDATQEEKEQYKLVKKSIDEQKVLIQKLDTEYKTLLTEWKQKYPNNANLFESASRVDMKMIQDNIQPDQVVLMYTSLPDQLIITAIDKTNINAVSVDVSKAKIEDIIVNQVINGYLESGDPKKEAFARDFNNWDLKKQEDTLTKISSPLYQLYKYLVDPAKEFIKDKSRIYFITDGMLSTAPMSALVSDFDDKGRPNFLVEKYDIGYLRPSFISNFAQKKKNTEIKRLLAVANPYNINFPMALLKGTISEIAKANSLLSQSTNDSDFALEVKLENKNSPTADLKAQDFVKSCFPKYAQQFNHPTETWLRDNLKNNKYEILYFSTHGMPMSDSYVYIQQTLKYLDKKGVSNPLEAVKNIRETHELIGKDNKNLIATNEAGEFPSIAKHVRVLTSYVDNMKTPSPLNGFLFLSGIQGKDILKEPIDSSEDGLLTMKEILELPDEYFSNTKYVILSACNTGVTYVPKYLVQDNSELLIETNVKEAASDLKDVGLIPGVDQVSFVDGFMNKGVENVFGTLWFIDDTVTSILMQNFISNVVAQENNQDAVDALNKAQRAYIKDIKEGKDLGLPSDYKVPLHPYFWGGLVVFGK